MFFMVEILLLYSVKFFSLVSELRLLMIFMLLKDKFEMQFFCFGLCKLKYLLFD